MNSIDVLINELHKSLIDLWIRHTTPSERANKIFNDFYDLVITMSFKKIISDSKLSMDILHFYYHYKRFRYVVPNDYPNYYNEEKNAKVELSKLINQITTL